MLEGFLTEKDLILPSAAWYQAVASEHVGHLGEFALQIAREFFVTNGQRGEQLFQCDRRSRLATRRLNMKLNANFQQPLFFFYIMVVVTRVMLDGFELWFFHCWDWFNVISLVKRGEISSILTMLYHSVKKYIDYWKAEPFLHSTCFYL